MSQAVIVCEGYTDRAFWKGCLAHLECSEPRSRGGVKDPWGLPVERGQHAYTSRGGGFIRVVRAGGKANVLPRVRLFLHGHSTHPVRRLIVNVYSDTSAGEVDAETGIGASHLLGEIRRIYPDAHQASASPCDIDTGAGAIVSLVRWKVVDPDVRLPAQQTLERLVCSAIARSYPERAEIVQAWLDSRRDAPPSSAKSYSWSYMAGWDADAGCEFFYTNLWNDRRVTEELVSLLSPSGAWDAVKALAQ